MYNSGNFLQGRRNKELQSGRQRVLIILQVYFPGISHALAEGGIFGAYIGAFVEKQEIGDGYRWK